MSRRTVAPRTRDRKGGPPRGQSLAEFALVLPILVLALVALFDLGFGVYAATTIGNAAREGARVAIVDQSQSAGVYRAQSEAAAAAIGLAIPVESVSVAFLDADLGGTCAARSIGCVAEVTVTYAYRPMTPLIGNLIGTVPLSATSRFPIERSLP